MEGDVHPRAGVLSAGKGLARRFRGLVKLEREIDLARVVDGKAGEPRPRQRGHLVDLGHGLVGERLPVYPGAGLERAVLDDVGRIRGRNRDEGFGVAGGPLGFRAMGDFAVGVVGDDLFVGVAPGGIVRGRAGF